jgi:hypothetical protein
MVLGLVIWDNIGDGLRLSAVKMGQIFTKATISLKKSANTDKLLKIHLVNIRINSNFVEKVIKPSKTDNC